LLNVKHQVIVEDAVEEIDVTALDLSSSHGSDANCSVNSLCCDMTGSAGTAVANEDASVHDATVDSMPRHHVPIPLPSHLPARGSVQQMLHAVDAAATGTGIAGLAVRANRVLCREEWALERRQASLEQRAVDRKAAADAQNDFLMCRLRSAVITNIVLKQKQLGLARAQALLAPLQLRPASCRFISRKRQKHLVQRMGKGQLAALFERRTLLRRCFAGLLLYAYSAYSDDEEGAGESGRGRHGGGSTAAARAEPDMELEEVEFEYQGQGGQVEAQAEPAPHEWVYGVDEVGRSYYFNRRTRVSRWEPPVLSTADGQWVRQIDEQDREFWVNITTGQAHWELPPEEYLE